MLMKIFDAVIFDLDGTLLDTLGDIARSANAVLLQRGFPEHPDEAYKYFCGDGVRVLFARALPAESRDEAIVLSCIDEFRWVYGANWDKTTKPYEGIPLLLDSLARLGLKTAVLSNKPHEATCQCVSALLAKWNFDAVLGQREGIPKKPDPAGALEIARLLSCQPERCLYVGDTATDMETALRARMFPLGVLWGFRNREELENAGAKLIVEHPGDLLPAVSKFLGQ
jgi:phosphoglycolate phosphatase